MGIKALQQQKFMAKKKHMLIILKIDFFPTTFVIDN